MTREQLEHLIRAAGEVARDDIVVIGSQAILATYPAPPAAMTVSMEADVYPRDPATDSDRIDGALGDGSAFHEAYGYYAHGVGPETVVAPKGWEDRLVQLDAPLLGVHKVRRSGWCLEVHDLMLAKLAAGRERDREFVETAIRDDLVDVEMLRARLVLMPDSHRAPVSRSLEGAIARSLQ